MSKQAKFCAGKDTFERMNYLYQASLFMENLSTKSNKLDQKNNANFLSTYYSNLLVNVAKKSVLRIDSDIKRNICKRCHSLLIPSATVKIRLKKKPTQNVRWTCKKCNTSRKYNTDKNYILWNEDPESVVEILDYGLPEKETSISKTEDNSSTS